MGGSGSLSGSRGERGRSGDRDRDRGSRRKDSRDRDRDRSRSRERRRRKSSRSRSRSRERSRRSRRSRSRSKSHSPTPPRRRKRTSNFDVPPQGMTLESAQAADLLTQTVLRQQAEVAALTTAAPALATSFGPPGVVPAAPAVNPFGNPGMGMAAASMQQTRHARRLYVGGITDVSDFELREYFNEIINKALDVPIDGGAVVSVYINTDRHFAFVELKSIELTTACINQLDGIPYKGNPLKIRRPTDYQPHLVPPTANPPPPLNLAKLGVIGTTVPDGPDKIFIGGLPYHLTDDQVKELLQAFGPLKAFHLVKDSGSQTSKGYAFCEYLDPSVGPLACQALNGMQLGGKTLTVRNAMSQTDAKSAQAAAGSVNSALSMGINNMAGLGAQAAMGLTGMGMAMGMPGMGMGMAIPGMPGMPMPGVMPPMPPGSQPTRVLVLLNMVTAEELTDDNEYEDIVNDVREEVSKYGQVNSLVIPRAPAVGVGKIFVEYTEPSSAQAAAASLQGRQFAGRSVIASYHDENKFAAQDFS